MQRELGCGSTQRGAESPCSESWTEERGMGVGEAALLVAEAPERLHGRMLSPQIAQSGIAWQKSAGLGYMGACYHPR